MGLGGRWRWVSRWPGRAVGWRGTGEITPWLSAPKCRHTLATPSCSHPPPRRPNHTLMSVSALSPSSSGTAFSAVIMMRSWPGAKDCAQGAQQGSDVSMQVTLR